jgi:hypothetical protein
VTLWGLCKGVLDLDYVSSVPLLGWLVVLAVAVRRKDRPAPALSLPAEAALPGLTLPIILALAVQILVNAAAVGVESLRGFALLRYMPHLVLLAPLPLLLLLDRLIERPRLWLAAGALLLLTNLPALSWWVRPEDRAAMPLSWWPPVYNEILVTARDDMRPVMDALANVQQPGEAVATPVLAASPAYMNDALVFYGGSRFRVAPDARPGGACAQRLAEAVGDRAWNELLAPQMAVIFLDRSEPEPPSAAIRAVLPWPRGSPDGARPELTRHSFPGSGETMRVAIVERLPR